MEQWKGFNQSAAKIFFCLVNADGLPCSPDSPCELPMKQEL